MEQESPKVCYTPSDRLNSTSTLTNNSLVIHPESDMNAYPGSTEILPESEGFYEDNEHILHTNSKQDFFHGLSLRFYGQEVDFSPGQEGRRGSVPAFEYGKEILFDGDSPNMGRFFHARSESDLGSPSKNQKIKGSPMIKLMMAEHDQTPNGKTGKSTTGTPSKGGFELLGKGENAGKKGIRTWKRRMFNKSEGLLEFPSIINQLKMRETEHNKQLATEVMARNLRLSQTISTAKILDSPCAKIDLEMGNTLLDVKGISGQTKDLKNPVEDLGARRSKATKNMA